MVNNDMLLSFVEKTTQQSTSNSINYWLAALLAVAVLFIIAIYIAIVVTAIRREKKQKK